jgi:hypothetical protein
VFVFVDDFDLATLAGLRYARSLRPTSLRAVHFVLDSAQAARLRQDWVRANTGVALDLVDCPDRRLAKAAAELVQAEALLPGVGVTAVLPRRSYTPLLGRLLHDRTADKIASVVSQIPHAAATIVPFDVKSRVETLIAREREKAAGVSATVTAKAASGAAAATTVAGRTEPAISRPEGESARSAAASTARNAAAPAPEATDAYRAEPTGPSADAPLPVEPATEPVAGPEGPDYNRPAPSTEATPIGQLPTRGRATVEGRVHAVEIRPVERNTVLACEIVDSTGQLTAMFYGRSHIPGLDPGAKVRLTGPVGTRGRAIVMINPAYELLSPGKSDSPAP